MKKAAGLILLFSLISSFITGCHSEYDIEADLDQQFELPIGQTAGIRGEDLAVTFDEVISDSRCPANVECITAGDARYKVNVSKGDETRLIEILEMAADVPVESGFLDYAFGTSLQPYPDEPDSIGPEDYRLQITVRILSAVDFGSEEDRAGIYAAVIRQLVEVDHSFGDNPPDIPNLYIVYTTTERSGGDVSIEDNPHILPEQLREDITSRLADLDAAVHWVDRFQSVPLQDDSLVEGGGAVVQLGNIAEAEGDTVQVAGSIYFANLAASGRTYVLEKINGSWEITGFTGPVWVS